MVSSATIPQFLIAAPGSNSGKTTITLGLLRALTKRGLKVQPFKCGPDYIDPILHGKASARASINLDVYMSSESHVKTLYSRHVQAADVAVVEGVMGLFDGAERMKGSSAEIAALLSLPVILVINAKAMAYSTAPLIYGFNNFHPDVNIKGVIFNNVRTASHYKFLQEACEDAGVEALGYLPPRQEIEIPSRHLGLSIASDLNIDTICDKIAASLGETVNIDRLLEITSQQIPVSISEEKCGTEQKLQVAVAKDEAFNFTYQENLEVLKEFGEIHFFSPLTDKSLPSCDFLYLAGGYPELFLNQLSANKSMLQSINEYCSKGGKALAECGGMMYLGRSIKDKEGTEFPMVDFLPVCTSMEKPQLHLGYRDVRFNQFSIKGHEFHYSSCTELEKPDQLPCSVLNARGMEVPAKLYHKASTVASYIHLYWGENPGFLEFVLAG